MCHSPSPSCVTRFAVMCHFSVFAVVSSPPSSPSRAPPTRRCACLSPAICQVSPTLPLSALPAVAIIRPSSPSPVNRPPTPSPATGDHTTPPPSHSRRQYIIYSQRRHRPPRLAAATSVRRAPIACQPATHTSRPCPLPSQNAPVIVLRTPGTVAARRADPLRLKFSVNYLHVR